MAYSDFTLDLLRHRFGLNIAFTVGAFASVPTVSVPPDVAAVVQKYLPLAVGGGTEKARSEYLVAPIVGQIYYETNRQIVVLSGIEFNVDRTQGLLASVTSWYHAPPASSPLTRRSSPL